MHIHNDSRKDAENYKSRNNKPYDKYYYIVQVTLRDGDTYNPSVRIEGTQMPTNIAVSRLPGPKTPNQSETEKRNDKKAAVRINTSDRLSFIFLI